MPQPTTAAAETNREARQRASAPAHLRHALKLTVSHDIDRASLRGATAVDRMADDMRVFAASGGGSVNESDMALLGWTKAQRSLYGDAARERALRQAADRRAA